MKKFIDFNSLTEKELSSLSKTLEFQARNIEGLLYGFNGPNSSFVKTAKFTQLHRQVSSIWRKIAVLEKILRKRNKR